MVVRVQHPDSSTLTPTGLPRFNTGGTPPTQDQLRFDLFGQPLPPFTPGEAGSETFERGINSLRPQLPPGELRFEAQQALDTIRERTARTAKTGESGASALAVRRGLGGSTIEQFGVAQAGEAAQRVGAESESAVLLENIRQDEAARRLSAEGLFQRSGAQDEAALRQDLTKQGLMSDEIASLRNIDFAMEQLEVQRILGEQGIAASRENIEAAREMARRQSRDQILGNLINAFGPSIVNKFMPSSSGGGNNFLGSSSSIIGPGGTGFSPQFGNVASPTANASGVLSVPGGAGGMTFGRLLGTAFAGYGGSRLGQNLFGQSRGASAGAMGGAIFGGIFGGPLGAFVGGTVGAAVGDVAGNFIDSAKDVIKKIF